MKALHLLSFLAMVFVGQTHAQKALQKLTGFASASARTKVQQCGHHGSAWQRTRCNLGQGQTATKQTLPQNKSPNEQYIVLSRHGETGAQREHIVQGWKESQHTVLTSKGRQDAKKLANTLADCFEDVHEIRHCGQMRTRQTSSYVAKKFPNAKVSQDGDLRGLRFGSLEGKTYEEAGIGAAKHEKHAAHVSIGDQSWRKSIAANKREEIEAHAQFHQRAKDSLARIIAKKPAGKCDDGQPYCTVVSGHDWTMREQLAIIAGKKGVKDVSDKPHRAEGQHQSAGYSVIHVKDIHKIPTKPGTDDEVDIDKASGEHFRIVGKMLKPGENRAVVCD